jgi:two-component system, OmpR family, response regulator MprA
LTFSRGYAKTPDLDGNTNVLDVYIGYLRAKTEAGGEPRLIQTVRGVGYALREA